MIIVIAIAASETFAEILIVSVDSRLAGGERSLVLKQIFCLLLQISNRKLLFKESDQAYFRRVLINNFFKGYDGLLCVRRIDGSVTSHFLKDLSLPYAIALFLNNCF